uniref:Uncharacterized protein n=2 Tax=Physcomitrium patens TaxID=3218 RepID=A0A2K1KEH7_PHYPA|nr:hypothetical protein PHYPA_008558 [Physcomitrium patens]
MVQACEFDNMDAMIDVIVSKSIRKLISILATKAPNTTKVAAKASIAKAKVTKKLGACYMKTKSAKRVASKVKVSSAQPVKVV